uniref:PX domain-containing protein n=1 Tax=Alexandrium andersonii TaxID=327968 RepID=A0A7S2J6R6_9DINO
MVVGIRIEDLTVERQGIVYYNITVTNESGRIFGVLRRYNDFVALNETLRSEGVLSLADLPRKGRTSLMKYAHHDAFLERRKEGLRQYLARIASQVQTVGQHPVLAQFLQEPPPVANLSAPGHDTAGFPDQGANDEQSESGPHSTVNSFIRDGTPAEAADAQPVKQAVRKNTAVRTFEVTPSAAPKSEAEWERYEDA